MPATWTTDGYVYVMARTDDVINVAGHRLSTGQMEEVVARHKDVAECAVIGVHDDLKGQLPVGYIVLNAGVNRDEAEIEKEVVQAGARGDRTGRGVQERADGAAPAEDAVGQDPARDDASDCRCTGLEDAGDDR